MKFSPSKIYVRFYYVEGSEMESYWGQGPFYAMFDTTKDAQEHVAETLEGRDHIHKIQVKSGKELSKAEA